MIALYSSALVYEKNLTHCYKCFTDPPAVDLALLEKLHKNPLKFKAGTKAKIEIPFSGSTPTS